MKAKELREMTTSELHQRMRERVEALFALRVQMATGTVENVRSARNTRRDIARIKTLLRERELAAPGKAGD